MVEVEAQVVGGGVHLAGDTVQVCVTVTAPALDPARSAQSSDVCEVLAWGSAQIHCQCSVNEARVRLPTSTPTQAQESAVTNADTSFAPCRGENGRVVLCTKPKILFCDLQLLPGQSRSFVYKETLPCDAPPTYRGQLLKYAYKITIGTQRLGAPIKQLRIPIRVIVLQGLSEACVYSESGELAPSNPFLHTPQRDTPRHTAFQIIQNASTRKNLCQYNITNGRGKVVKFCIYKSSFRLGEDIVATFDFTHAEVPCVQYSVTLQSEEVIAENCRTHPNQKPTLVKYSKSHEVCLNLSHTHLLLPIPLHLTPTFTTDLVSLNWHLHFEFVTSTSKITETIDKTATTITPAPSSPPPQDTSSALTPPDSPQPQEDQSSVGLEGVEWKAPSVIDIETMIWDLNITILPTTPNQVSQAVCMPSNHLLPL